MPHLPAMSPESKRRSVLGKRTSIVKAPPFVQQSFAVILTGSTSHLGAYILDLLLANPHVRKIICLNRSADARAEQLIAHSARGLATDLELKRVFFLQADLSRERLGLEPDSYKVLIDGIDLVIHNALPGVHANGFEGLKPTIDSVQHLIDFCVQAGKDGYPTPPSSSGSAAQSNICTKPIRLLYLSSVVDTFNLDSRTVPGTKISEVELTDWRVARNRYGQANLVCERLLAQNARKLGLPVAIIRVGQLAGPVLHDEQGKWPETEWLPSLIQTSYTLHALPETLGPMDQVDWVPVDLAASVIVDIATDSNPPRIASPAETDFEREDAPRRSSTRRTSTGSENRVSTDNRKALAIPVRLGNSSSTTQHVPREANFYHVVNPLPTKWTALVATISRYMPSSVMIVPFTAWVSLLEQTTQNAKGSLTNTVDEDALPAARHLDVFLKLRDKALRSPNLRVAEFDTRCAVQASPTLAEMSSVEPDWMGLWMRQWKWHGTKEDRYLVSKGSAETGSRD